MKLGKVPETILKRSIVKNVKIKRSEVLEGSGVGEDCAVLDLTGNSLLLSSTETETASPVLKEQLALIKASNNVAVKGGEPKFAELSIVLPKDCEESDIKEMMRSASAMADELSIDIVGGHTTVSGNVNTPIVTVTAFATAGKKRINKAKPGDDVIVTKWIGLESTVILSIDKEAELVEKFPKRMIYDGAGFKKYLSVIPEAATAVKSGANGLHDVSEGGIYKALWELAEGSGVGLEIDLRRIPLKQETVEICNFFDISPYEAASTGSLIITTEDGTDMILKLKEAGIDATIVGKCTQSNDRVLINEDTRRFLVPGGSDELYKIYQ